MNFFIREGGHGFKSFTLGKEGIRKGELVR